MWAPGRRPSFSAVERRGSRGGRTCREEVGTPEDARVRLDSSWMSCWGRGRPVGDVGLREWAAARGDRRSQRPNRPGCGGWPRAGGRAAGRRRGACGAPADTGKVGEDQVSQEGRARPPRRPARATVHPRGRREGPPRPRRACQALSVRRGRSRHSPTLSFHRRLWRCRMPGLDGRNRPPVHAVHAIRLSIIPSSSSPHRGRHAPPPLTMPPLASRTSSAGA
jgi:hypothetical protein